MWAWRTCIQNNGVGLPGGGVGGRGCMPPWSLESFTFSLVPITWNEFPRSLKFWVKVPLLVKISLFRSYESSKNIPCSLEMEDYISLFSQTPGRPSKTKCAVIEIFDDYYADLMDSSSRPPSVRVDHGLSILIWWITGNIHGISRNAFNMTLTRKMEQICTGNIPWPPSLHLIQQHASDHRM